MITAAFPLFSISTEASTAPSRTDTSTGPATVTARCSVPATLTMTGTATLGTMATAIPFCEPPAGGSACSSTVAQ